MNRSQRFRPIVHLAEHGRDEAVRRLGETLRNAEDQRQRLAEIMGYRDEYARRFGEAAGNGLSGARVREYQQFLARLNLAVEQQTKIVEAAERDSESCRSRWRDARTRLDVLDRVVARFRAEEDLIDRRREQGVTDEHAQRRRKDRGE